MLRIAHLSDLHAVAGPEKDSFGQERVVKALLKSLDELSGSTPPDLIVFSGDLSTNGTESALAQGRRLLLEPLADRFGGVPILLAPGNHDVDRSRVDTALHAGLKQVLTSREAVQERLAAETHAREARRGLTAWDTLTEEWDPGLNAIHLGPHCSAYRLECKGLSLAIGCFDTAWRAIGGPEDQGHLILGADYVREFVDSTDDADLRIAVFHHPPDWLADFDAGGVRTALEQGHCLVLTGHNHKPDPSLLVTIRGDALYSQAPCVYDSPSYANGYSLIDIDAGKRTTVVTLQRWFPETDRFGPDTRANPDGSQSFDWPLPTVDSIAVYPGSDLTALEPIVELAEEQSLFIPNRAEGHAARTLDELVVPPRFWPIPYNEIFDRSLEPTHRPGEIDPLKEMAGKRVLIVSGPKMSGVTTALYWLLGQHFQHEQTHLPVYIRTDANFGLTRIRKRVQQARSHAGRSKEETAEIPVIAAVDDVEPGDSRALGRMITLLRTDPNLVLVLGSHDHAHHAITAALEKYEINAGRVYLGNTGRTETKQLVARTVGSEETDLVAKVLEFGQKLRLPRNPFNLLALASVIGEERSLIAINETGLLEAFVARFLADTSVVDPEGVSMDYRRWEHLLQSIAKEVVESDQARIPRQTIVQLILDYYRERGWTEGRLTDLVDSLIDCRVLVEDEDGVGFRYPVMLHLFAAKATADDPELKAHVFADLVTYGPIVKQVAGLKRNDAATLALVAKEAAVARDAVADRVEAGQFDRIEDRLGWSKDHDFDEARKLARPTPMPPSEEELDEMIDELIDEPEEAAGIRPFEDRAHTGATDKLVAIFGLAAGVLQNSELVADTDLRTRVLREVITGWSQITILHAIEEDAWPQVYSLVEESARAIEDDELRQSMVEHLAMLLVINVMSVSLYMEAGSPYQQSVLAKLLDDEEFMEQSAHALFATMLYAMLRFAGWPERLQKLYELHGNHPMISQIIEEWTLEEYLHGDVSKQDMTRIESLLIAVRTPRNLTGVRKRQQKKSKIQAELQAARTQARYRKEHESEVA
jgi:predicted MPP superfamily phosphohydrolase